MAAEAQEGRMTTTAWLMLLVTWSIIIFFTGRFFWMVLQTPITPERDAQTRDGILEKDA
jgi:hypothetical protein